MAEWIAAIAAVLAAIVALVAWRSSFTESRRSNTIAARASGASDEANKIAKDAGAVAAAASAAAAEANRLAAESNEIARQALDESRRSADATSAAVELQRDAAALAAASRLDAQRAQLAPITWESRARGNGPQGFQIRNYSQASASNVRAYIRLGDAIRMARLDNFGPAAYQSVSHGLEDYSPVTGLDGIPPVDNHWAAGRVCWTNADGTEGDSGWQRIPRN